MCCVCGCVCAGCRGAPPQIERQVEQGRASWDCLEDQQRQDVAVLAALLAAAEEKGDPAAQATVATFSPAELARLHGRHRS